MSGLHETLSIDTVRMIPFKRHLTAALGDRYDEVLDAYMGDDEATDWLKYARKMAVKSPPRSADRLFYVNLHTSMVEWTLAYELEFAAGELECLSLDD